MRESVKRHGGTLGAYGNVEIVMWLHKTAQTYPMPQCRQDHAIVDQLSSSGAGSRNGASQTHPL